jgi:hypothetical protein
MARPPRLERGTPGLEDRGAIQASYGLFGPRSILHAPDVRRISWTLVCRLSAFGPFGLADDSRATLAVHGYFRFSTMTLPSAFMYTRYLFLSLHDTA